MGDFSVAKAPFLDAIQTTLSRTRSVSRVGSLICLLGHRWLARIRAVQPVRGSVHVITLQPFHTYIGAVEK